jgi:hypothetical protein
VRLLTRDAEEWWVGTSGALLARRNCTGVVLCGLRQSAHTTSRSECFAAGSRVAVELASAAAVARAEGEVVCKTRAVVEQEEAWTSKALEGVLANSSDDHRRGCLACPLLEGGEPSGSLAKSNVGVEEFDFVSDFFRCGFGGDCILDKA